MGRSRLHDSYIYVRCVYIIIIKMDSRSFPDVLIGDSAMLCNTRENRVNLALRAGWTIAKADENLGQTPAMALPAPLQ